MLTWLMNLGFAGGEGVVTRYVIIGPIRSFADRQTVESPANRVEVSSPNARAFITVPGVDE